jgi:hypothetical protein
MKSIKPVSFGEILTVDQCKKIDISDLLREYRAQLKTTTLSADLMGVPLVLTSSKTRYGSRYWFVCPNCSGRVGIVYQHPVSGVIGCRTCLKLDYRSHRFKGMIENNVIQGESNE